MSMAQTILYYPTIDIQDGSWLRSALLYWDKISSIMPYSNYTGLSPELRYLKECGIYKPLFPQEIFRSEYNEDFVATVISRLEHYQEKVSSRRKRSNHLHAYSRLCDRSLHDQIHYNKFSSEILEYLYTNSYISCSANDWVEIDSQVASIYMQTLAEFVIKCYPEDIVLGTDKAKYLNHIYHPTRPSKKTPAYSCPWKIVFLVLL